MSTRRHRCYEYQNLKHLIGPLWIADLMDSFQVKSPSGLRRIFEEKTNAADHCRWTKIYRGSLPGDSRIQRVTKKAPDGDRVLRLPLWELLADPEPTDETLDAVLNRLSPPELRDLVFDNETWRRWPVEFPLIYLPLTLTGTVDALTALLVKLVDETRRWTPGDPHDAVWLMCREAYRLFLRLAAFPPFFSVWPQFYEHLANRFWRIQLGDEFVIPRFTVNRVRRYPEEARNVLAAMWALRLVEPVLDEQMRMVYTYFECPKERRGFKALMNAHGKILKSKRPVTIQPTSPAYKLLRRLGHPCVRRGCSVVLPWQDHRLRFQPRIANLFGPMQILSTAQPRSSSVAGSVAD